MGTLLYLISNAIHIYAVSVFLDAFLGNSRLNHKLKSVMYLVYYIFGSLCWIFIHSSTLNIAFNIFATFFITIQYNTSLKKKVFSVISSQATAMFIEWIAFTLFGNSEAVRTGIVQYIIILIVAFLFKRIYVRNEDYSSKSKYSWLLILMAFGTVAIGVLTVNDDSTHDYVIAVILLLINLMNFYIYNLEQKSLESQHTLELIETSNNAYKTQIQIMNETQKKLRFIRHDFKNHMNKIRNLIQNENYQKIQEYLDEMEEAVTVKSEFSKTGNKDVDSLINYELTIAAEFGTEIICNIELPNELNVTSFDMTVILGNLLNNAVEALRQTERKVLIITVKFNKGVIRIDIENSYDAKYKRKPDGREHGIGLMSVKNTLEKYHGSIKTFPEDNKYHTTVVLFNSLE